MDLEENRPEIDLARTAAASDENKRKFALFPNLGAHEADFSRC